MKRFFIAAAAVLALASCSVKAPEGTALFDFFKYEGADDFYVQNPLPGDDYVYNPILAGWYSDPSICTNGEGDYFLISSTFCYFPGVPLFHSRDLVNWEQIGNILDRPEHLPHLDGQRISGGIYAPDITYNPANKTYYMITTDVAGGNFYVKTQDPWGDWSDPIYVPVVQGIDPSFFFDDNGKAYIVSNDDAPDHKPEYNGHRTIRCVEFDVANDCTVGERKIIVNKGTRPENNPYWIEGPHIYKIDGQYYLMCAEGGTGDWHSEVILRAPVKSDIMNPDSWEECPNNPILTQRTGVDPNRPDIVTSTGHADLVQDKQGRWWAVFLGCRAYEGPFYNTGRDTYMLPVTWKDGWPEILEKGKVLPTVVDKPGLLTGRTGNSADTPQLTGNFSYTDRFDTEKLNQRWIFLRNPEMNRYKWGNGGLTIQSSANDISELKPLSAVFCRQQHTTFAAETEVAFTPRSDKDIAGLALLQNEQYNFVLGKTMLDGRPAVTLTRAEKGKVLVGSAFLKGNAPLQLKIEGDGRYYSFYYREGGDWRTIAAGVDAVNLSTARSGGFIGACIGLYTTAK